MGERNGLVVLGRKIGTYTGWDQADHLTLVFHEFEPITDFVFPGGTLGILYEQGIIEAYEEEGEVIATADLIDAIKHLPMGRV